MTKVLSATQQIAHIRQLRRACPFVSWSGLYGFSCGQQGKAQTYASTAMDAPSKERRHCSLACQRLRRAAFQQAIDITISSAKLNRLSRC